MAWRRLQTGNREKHVHESARKQETTTDSPTHLFLPPLPWSPFHNERSRRDSGSGTARTARCPKWWWFQSGDLMCLSPVHSSSWSLHYAREYWTICSKSTSAGSGSEINSGTVSPGLFSQKVPKKYAHNRPCTEALWVYNVMHNRPLDTSRTRLRKIIHRACSAISFRRLLCLHQLLISPKEDTEREAAAHHPCHRPCLLRLQNFRRGLLCHRSRLFSSQPRELR